MMDVRSALVPLMLISLTLAACVPAGKPTSVPSPTPVASPLPAPAPLADWQDWPRTPGTWRYQRDGAGSRATFGGAEGQTLVTIRCAVATRQLFLMPTGALPERATIRTSTLTRTVVAQPLGDGAATAGIALAANDPLLDAIAFTRGRFTIERPDSAPLVLPPYAEVGRVIEDCRG